MEILRSRAELYHVVNLQAPQFTPPGALESCRVYAWTVRAHLWIDGFPRVTEWAGMHNQPFGFVPPWRYRRDEPAPNGVANPSVNRFVFRTRPPPGFRSCED
jgi:hypothetical protein